MKKYLELMLFVLGLLLLGFVIHSVEPAKLLTILRTMNGWQALVFTVYPLVCCLDVWGWQYDPALGVAVSLLKRLRQMFWTAVGFGIWGMYQRLEGAVYAG